VQASETDHVALERAVIQDGGFLEYDPDGTPPLVAPPEVPWPGQARGRREAAVLNLPELTQRDGLRVAQISDSIGCRPSNTYKLLHSLEDAGVLDAVPRSEPLRYRLASRRRAAIQAFARLADTIAPGEWTTCADISLASRGDTAAAPLVCWAATFMAEFPAAHRVLLDGGRLHPLGHPHRRRRPGLLHPALVEEGITFDEYGRANRRQRVGWDDLTARVPPKGRRSQT
jgi:hypothetical protein